MMRCALSAILCIGLCVAAGVAADSGNARNFGTLQRVAIRWRDNPQVELTANTLRLTRPGEAIRSEPLPLVPLQRYGISATIARGPGSNPRFMISYVDARGDTVEWMPAWQHPNSAHADWLPLSAHAQRYVQGFVLPPGASQPSLVLRLEAKTDKAPVRFLHWTLSDLRIEALGKVACCDRLGDNLLWSGDFEAATSDGQPKHWSQWSPTADNRVEVIELPGEPAHSHVLRIQAGSRVHLFSRYFAPVSSGRAYRISLQARGQGRVELDAHSMIRERPVPLRVGNRSEGVAPIAVHAQAWQELSTVWFAEAPNVAQAEVVLSISAESTMEIDTVELRPYE